MLATAWAEKCVGPRSRDASTPKHVDAPSSCWIADWKGAVCKCNIHSLYISLTCCTPQNAYVANQLVWRKDNHWWFPTDFQTHLRTD